MTDSTKSGDLLQDSAEAIGHALGRAAAVVDASAESGETLVADAAPLAAGQPKWPPSSRKPRLGRRAP